MKKTCLFATILAVVLSAHSAFAESFEDGLKAYRDGNYEVAMVEWRPLAEKGDPAAQLEMGHMYRRGSGVERDFKVAAKWYRKAAEQDFQPAFYYRGLFLLNGLGEVKNPIEAAKWLKRAAVEENSDAPYLLGRMYKRGTGVNVNLIEAYKWFAIGAENGMRQAEINLKIVKGHMSYLAIREAKSEAYDWMEKYRN